MPSVGESDLLIDSWVVGKFRVESIHAVPAIFPRLGLSLRCQLLDAKPDEYSARTPLVGFELRDLTGDLRFEQASEAIGVVRWMGQRGYVRSSAHLNEHHLQLICDLDAWRIEAIEERRKGAAPTFSLELWPVIVCKERQLVAQVQSIRLNIPREQWLKFLGAAGHQRFEILEVPIPKEADLLSRAIEHTKAARQRVDVGDYEEAIARCRKALDVMYQRFPRREGKDGDEDGLRIALASATDDRRAKEFVGIIGRIKQLGAFAHHDLGEAGVEYSRAESLFIIRTTESILALVGSLAPR